LRLFDLVGNLISNSEFHGDTYQLNTENLNSGTYLIQTTDLKTGQSKVSKLIKR
jgi:hypothetical protein